MDSFKSRFLFFFYLLVGGLLLTPFLLKDEEVGSHNKKVNELYDVNLVSINSIDEALVYIENLETVKNRERLDTFSFVSNTSKFTKNRFYHGLSRYNLSDNWLASVGGTFLWDHFSAIVNPDDILKHSEGLCSQQTIVFMEILKRRGIKTRSVGLGYIEGPGHFLTEVYYNGSWHLYDVNMEPEWKKIKNHHISMDYYLKNKDTLYLPYQSIMPRKTFNKLMEKVQYGKINDFPAKKMQVFHTLTKWTTYLLPIIFFFLAFRVYHKSKFVAAKRKLEVKKEEFIHN